MEGIEKFYIMIGLAVVVVMMMRGRWWRMESWVEGVSIIGYVIWAGFGIWTTRYQWTVEFGVVMGTIG